MPWCRGGRAPHSGSCLKRSSRGGRCRPLIAGEHVLSVGREALRRGRRRYSCRQGRERACRFADPRHEPSVVARGDDAAAVGAESRRRDPRRAHGAPSGRRRPQTRSQGVLSVRGAPGLDRPHRRASLASGSLSRAAVALGAGSRERALSPAFPATMTRTRNDGGDERQGRSQPARRCPRAAARGGAAGAPHRARHARSARRARRGRSRSALADGRRMRGSPASRSSTGSSLVDRHDRPSARSAARCAIFAPDGVTR